MEGRLGRLLAACVALLVVGGAASLCPPKCMCVKRTVRCMRLQIDRVPLVPPDTEILDLRFNKIRETPPGAFSNLRHLHTLLLNNNHLTIIREGAFAGLENLRYLSLYKNKIHHIDDAAFKGLVKLQQLYLHFNNIESFNQDVFYDLPSLERLFLHNNKIQRLPSEAFSGLGSLKRLRLDGNSLVCDCSIVWLMVMINESNQDGKKLQAAANCASPNSMRGLSIASMDTNQLHCDGPVITDGPKDIEVDFDGTALFTCTVGGNPLPDIVWMKNSNEIPLSDPRYQILEDGSLKIDNPVASDQGVFECMAISPLGEVKSNEARIILQDQPTNSSISSTPEFVITPADIIANIGENSITLNCVAKGSPRPHIIWYHDDKKLIINQKIKIDSEGSIIIHNIDETSAGIYRCEAENIYGKIYAVASLRIVAAPVLFLTQEPSTHRVGEKLRLLCKTQAYPAAVVSWFKDGSVLEVNSRISITPYGVEIQPLTEQDAGIYICRAENTEGFKEEFVKVRVTKNIPTTVHLIFKPFDIETIQGSKIELPCRGEGNPPPPVTWKKDGSNLIKTERHKISRGGSLYITNVTQTDSGRYECSAVNEYGRASDSALLFVKEESLSRPGDKFVHIAFAEASKEVDYAINTTISLLFDSDKRSSRPNMRDLYRVIRFPNAPARELARAAEVYERTLVNIRRHVNEGKVVNITSDFNYKEILSPEHINLVAKLSGCISHRRKSNCTNICFHSKYRSFDGTCNNLQNPTWGASNTPFRRILKPIYENGFSQPVGWTKGIKYNGYELPSSRAVSSRLISTHKVTPDKVISHMVMQWGQFLDHDMDHATPSVSSQSWDGIDCKRSCDYAAPCFPIDIPKGDGRIDNRRCIDFIRSSSVCGSGMTSVFFDEVQPREQINQLTSFIDASQVYGFAEDIAQDLRNLTSDDGFMRHGVIFPGKKPLLPYSSGNQMDCRHGALESDIKCFAAGDIRANEQVGLLAMHTLWLREHNRIAQELGLLNPQWNGDTVYHEARKIVSAEMQHITYSYWLPIILGPSGIKKLDEYRRYDPSIDPTIANVFATAALRFGHSLINPVLQRLDKDFNEIPEGHLPLHKAFFASWRVIEEGGIDPLLRGLFIIPAKLKTPGQNLNSDLTEKLFEIAHAVALDLAAMNIQRSRDHAIPSYTEWRKFCRMQEVDSFDDLRGEISDAGVRSKLKELYGSVHNVDVWVGGILEDQMEGAKVGPLFQCLLVDQFKRLRNGDRFWYENAEMFKPEQLAQIKQTTLARVLCDNGDSIDKITKNVFIIPQRQDGLVECDEILGMNLRLWADCTDCDGGFCGGTLSADPPIQRSRRSVISQIINEENFSMLIKEQQIIVHNLRTKVQELERVVMETDKRIKNLQECDCKVTEPKI